MDLIFGEVNKGVVTNVVNLMSARVEVCNLDESVSYHNVIVLIVTHESRKNYLAGKRSLVSKACRLWTKDDAAFFTLVQVRASAGLKLMALKAAKCSLRIKLVCNGCMQEV